MNGKRDGMNPMILYMLRHNFRNGRMCNAVKATPQHPAHLPIM